MKFYTVTANFDMTSHSELEVKQFVYLDNAFREAAEQVNEFLNCISGGELDQDQTDWDSYNEIFQFMGVSRSGEDFVTVHIEESTFEDFEEWKEDEMDFMGITFDDYTKDSDKHCWSQVCQSCVEEKSIPELLLDRGLGHGICGVKGCDKESEHYIDFLRGNENE